MSRIAIVTDTTATVPADLLAKYDIKVAPQVLIWGEKSLLDEIDIKPDEFYSRLATAEVMPTTSQATIGAFKTIFEPLVAEGRPILAILISAKLSGTVQSAEQAKAMFPGATIEIVDSESAAMALGFQVLAAARAAADGKSFQEVVSLAKSAKDHCGVIFVVDTLEFLHRGGRIGGASRLLGTALNIKPLLHLEGGKIEPLERVRTKTRAHARLLELIDEKVRGKGRVRIAALHAAAPGDARHLLDEAAKRNQLVESFLTVVSPVIGAHVGPGTVGLAYSTDL